MKPSGISDPQHTKNNYCQAHDGHITLCSPAHAEPPNQQHMHCGRPAAHSADSARSLNKTPLTANRTPHHSAVAAVAQLHNHLYAVRALHVALFHILRGRGRGSGHRSSACHQYTALERGQQTPGQLPTHKKHTQHVRVIAVTRNTHKQQYRRPGSAD